MLLISTKYLLLSPFPWITGIAQDVLRHFVASEDEEEDEEENNDIEGKKFLFFIKKIFLNSNFI